MSAYTPTQAIGLIRDYLNAADVLPGDAHYPPQPAPSPRSAQLRWEGWTKDEFREQVWDLVVACYVIAPALNESAWDVAAIDPLVGSVCDLFSPVNADAYHLRSGTDGVDGTSATTGAPQDFAGYYAQRVEIHVKLRRVAATIPAVLP